MRGKRFIVVAAMLALICAALVGAAPRRAAADDLPTVSAADVTVQEGDSGSAAIRIPVDLSAPVPTTVKVPYKIIADPDDTATSSADARLFRGTLTFLPNVVSKYVTITEYGDTVPEPDQHVEVVLSNPIGNASLGKIVGLLTIVDDDTGAPPGPITASIGDVSIVEGNDGTRTAYMPVLLSAPATVRGTKVVFHVDCSASSLVGVAAGKMTGTIGFGIGTRSKFIPLNIEPNTTPDEILNIYQDITSQISSLHVIQGRGAVTIVDDDSSLPSNPGRPVPNFTEESLPTGSTFNAQAVGDQEMTDQTPQGNPGTFEYHDPQGGSVIRGQSAPSLSSDGRYVAFISPQTDLVPGDTNGLPDVFVRDRATGTTERVSLREDGTEIQPIDFPVSLPPGVTDPGTRSYDKYGYPLFTDVSISADGRYVAYSTYAALDPRLPSTIYDENDVYLYDRVLHTTELVSVDTAGNPLLGATRPTVSAHGRYVLFSGGVVNGHISPSVYVRDRVAGTTTLVYDAAMYGMYGVTMSANGRFAVIPSRGPDCSTQELDVVDLQDGSVERVDVTDDGAGAAQYNQFATMTYQPAISGDGRYIAFKSNSWSLIPGMTGPNTGWPGAYDDSTFRVYVRDLALKSTTMLENMPVGPDYPLSISDDGNLVANMNTLYDRAAGTMQTITAPGSQYLAPEVGRASLSADGRYLGFTSEYYVVYASVIYGDSWVQRVR
jgi:Tol biopolymer transport system component